MLTGSVGVSTKAWHGLPSAEGDGEAVGHEMDWRPHLVRWMTVASAVAVMASLVTYAIARAAAATPQGEFWAEVHENLSVGVERNLPTWWATVLWAGFALAAWAQWLVASEKRMAWMFLSLVGWGASIDEALMLHDRLSAPSGRIETIAGIDLGGATWVLLGGVVAASVGLTLLRFVLGLPGETRRDLLVGAALFLLGAVGFEVLSSLFFESTGEFGWAVVTLIHIEEGLEFAGVVIATRGLLRLTPSPEVTSPPQRPTNGGDGPSQWPSR